MSWEVLTMRSAKSFFNGAIARSDLRRYWPVLFLYVGLWLLFLPIPVWNRAAERNPALVNLTELCADTYATAVVLALIFGGIGFLDDFEKVKHKQNLGLTAIQKFLLQLAAAVAFLCLMRFEGMLTPNLYVPFFNTQIVMSWWVYMVFAAFVIVGTVNAVNITDGIDGLAGSVTVPVGLFFTVLAIWWQGYEQLGIYAAALVGGILGFLIYNFHPAKVFMGDTGSLFLGGTVAALAFAYDMPLVLIPVGFVYICETLSDILQVIYFKATHGKRLFKMAPLHHHFELCGWSEGKLVAVFTSVSALCCLAALFGVLNRFHF